MANIIETVDWLTMESLRILLNKMQIGQFFNTDLNGEFTKPYAVGETVRVKLPQRWLVTDGLAYSPQSIARRHTTVAMDQVFGVHFDWDSVEQALKLERGRDAIKREYIDPAMAQLANEIDDRCSKWAFENTNNVVGILGTNPADLSPFRSARQKLVENSCPEGDKGMVVSPAVQNGAISSSQALFSPANELSKQYREGSIGKYAGFDWYESVNLRTHTAGTWAGAVTISGAGQSGSSLVITATAGDTFKKGDRFSIASVNAANPVTRRSVGSVKHFVITQDLTAAGGAGADTINFLPSIDGPGSQYQNVDALPGNAAALTLWPGTTSPNAKSGVSGIAIHKNAFALVGVAMEEPKAVELARTMRDPKTGIAINFVRAFDPRTRQMINRFDVLIGFGNLYPDNCAVVVAGST